MTIHIVKKCLIIISLLVFFACLLNIISTLPNKALSLKCGNPFECKDVLEKTVKSLIGARYSYGDTGKKGFDCSGFVLTLCKSILGDNLQLPRTSQDMYNSIKQSVSLDNAEKGDLIFFKTGKGISHVAMYWGKDNQGNELMCHASSSRGVEMRAFKRDSYWNQRLVGIKRVNPLFQVLHDDKNLINSDYKSENVRNDNNSIENTNELKQSSLVKEFTHRFIENSPSIKTDSKLTIIPKTHSIIDNSVEKTNFLNHKDINQINKI